APSYRSQRPAPRDLPPRAPARPAVPALALHVLLSTPVAPRGLPAIPELRPRRPRPAPAADSPRDVYERRHSVVQGGAGEARGPDRGAQLLPGRLPTPPRNAADVPDGQRAGHGHLGRPRRLSEPARHRRAPGLGPAPARARASRRQPLGAERRPGPGEPGDY